MQMISFRGNRKSIYLGKGLKGNASRTLEKPLSICQKVDKKFYAKYQFSKLRKKNFTLVFF